MGQAEKKTRLMYEIYNTVKNIRPQSVDRALALLGDAYLYFNSAENRKGEPLTIEEKIASLPYGRLVQLRAYLSEEKYNKVMEVRDIIGRVLHTGRSQERNIRWVSPLEFRCDWERLQDLEKSLIELRTDMELEEDVHEDFDGDDEFGRGVNRILFSYKLKFKHGDKEEI